MFWKNWPYWLKGGMIFGGFVLLLMLCLFGYMWISAYYDADYYPPVYGPSLGLSGGPACYVNEWINGKTNKIIEYGYTNGKQTHEQECIGILIFDFVASGFFAFFGFLAGSVSGLIFGIIKNKIKNNN